MNILEVVDFFFFNLLSFLLIRAVYYIMLIIILTYSRFIRYIPIILRRTHSRQKKITTDIERDKLRIHPSYQEMY